MKENPVLNFEINTISYVVSFINFINITLIYHIRKPCDFESFQGAKFKTLLLVYCDVQVCYGTAVEHRSLLNWSGVCDRTVVRVL